MTDRVENFPNKQDLNFSTPNRFVVSPKSPSIQSDGVQIIRLGAGRRQVTQQAQQSKLNSLINILKMMFQWRMGTEAINQADWMNAELRKYLLQFDHRCWKLYMIQMSLIRAFKFDDIIERGTIYDYWILGITELTNERKIFGFACQDEQKFQNSIANAQISESGLNLSRRIRQQHLQSQQYTSINKRLKEDLMKLKQQNSSEYHYRTNLNQSQITNLKIQEAYEMIKQQLRRSCKIANNIQTFQPTYLQLEEKKKKVESLERQKDELSRDNKFLQEQLNHCKAKLTSSEQRHSFNQLIIKANQQNVLKSNSQTKDLQNKFEEVQRQNYQLKDKLYAQINSSNRHNQQIKNLTKKIEQAKHRLQQKQLKEQAMTKQIQQLEQSRRSSQQISIIYVREVEQFRQKYQKSQNNISQLVIQSQNLRQRVKDLQNQIQFQNRTKAINLQKEKAECLRIQQLQLSDNTYAKQLQTLKAQLQNQKLKIYNTEIIRKRESNELLLLKFKLQQISKSQKQKQQSLQKLKAYCSSLQTKLNDRNTFNNQQQTAFSVQVKQLQQQNRSLKQNTIKNNEIIQKSQQNQIRIAQLLRQIDYHKANAKRQVQQKLKIEELYSKLFLNQSILQQQLFTSRNKIAQKSQMIDNMQKSMQTLQQSLKSQTSSQSQAKILSNRIKQVQQQKTKRIFDLNQQRAQKSKLQQKISNQKSEIQYLNQQIQMLNRILEQKNSQSIIRHQKKEKQFSQDSNKQKALMSSKITQLQEKLMKNDDQIVQWKQKYQKKSAELSQAYQQSSLKDEQILKLSQQISQAIKISNNLKLQNQQILTKYTLQKKNLQAKLSKTILQPSIKIRDPNNFNYINLLFQHQILYDQFDKKQYLTNVIEKQMRKQIAKTQLLFTYDPLNKTNFHMYIDDKINIVFVIKLVNGNYIAAYSEGIFKPKYTSKDAGIIISLTNKKYFTLADSNKKAIIYDEYFVIFGNSQIRLKSQQNLLFSNFGINNSHYNSKGQKVNVLLGQGTNREVPLQTYEIYQITFDN